MSEGFVFGHNTMGRRRHLRWMVGAAMLTVTLLGVLCADRIDAQARKGSLRQLTQSAHALADTLPQTMREAVARDQGQTLARVMEARLEDRQLERLAVRWLEAQDKSSIAMNISLLTTPDRLVEALARNPVPASPPVGRARFRARTESGHGASYQVHVPADYTPERSWPVHISLHGGGGTPGRSCAVNWNGEPEAEGVILVCPQTEKGMWWMPRGEARIQAVLRDVRARYHVDTDRVSIGGASSGGFGVWHNAAKYPWVYRAAVPRCAATPNDPATLANLHDMPTYLLHGARDGTISVHHSRRSHRLLTKLGSDVTYREEEGFGHSFMRPRNMDVLAWLSPKERTTSEEFTYRTMARGPAPGRVHFLTVTWGDDYRGGLELKGRIVVSQTGGRWVNEVYVDSTGTLKAFTVLLPEGKWRPDAPVHVYYNDELVQQSPAPKASVEAVLASWKDHQDPGLLVRHAVEVPAL